MGLLNVPSAGDDVDAIHDNESSEISAVTEKASPVNADLVLIEDSAAANAKKKVQVGNLPGGSGGGAMDAGDPSTYDFQRSDLTVDGAYHDLDLSGKIGGAIAALIHLRVIVQSDAAAHQIKFRTKGNSNDINIANCKVQVANIQAWYDVWVISDSDGVIEYNTNAATAIYITVASWITL